MRNAMLYFITLQATATFG